jgi:hypothetical protein
MSLALVHLKGLAWTKPVVNKPAKTKDAVKALGSTLEEIICFIKTPQ